VVERRAIIADRLGLPADAPWPKKPLYLAAVDADSLALCALDAKSGALLVDAVAASCAIPGVWPATPIGGRYYVDGGAWLTVENAQLAEGFKAVLILSPLNKVKGAVRDRGDALAKDIGRLESQGTKVVLIAADEESLRTMPAGPLDPATRTPAAE